MPNPSDRLSIAALYALEAASGFLRSGPVAVLSGAGLSTDSGIPDYRGEGRIARHPMTFDLFLSGVQAQQRYWSRSFVGYSRIATAAPNSGHFAVANAEQAGLVAGVITQNVDGLHQAAGSSEVLDLHGRLDKVICLACREVVSRELVDQWIAELNPSLSRDVSFEYTPDGDAEIDFNADFRIPMCRRCNGTLKPDVVFFGEQVPIERVQRATRLVEETSALVVAGSSLAVNSGLRFARMAHKLNKPVVVVNIGPTKADEFATAKIEANTSDALEVLFND